jgi:hypothetical protein
MIDHIFENINISTLKFFVFDHTTGKENIQAAIFSLLEILVKSIALGESLRFNRSAGILTVPSKKHVFIFLTTTVF